MSKHAVILVDQGVQDEEFIYPYYRLQEAGYDVAVASQSSIMHPVKGKYGIPVPVTHYIEGLQTTIPDPAVVIVPGGWECPEKLRMNEDVLKYLKMVAHSEGSHKRVIGAICHGPLVLISAGLVKSVKATCYRGMRDDLVNAGAEHIDEPVVVSQTGDRCVLVTAQHYRDNPRFMKTILSYAEKP